MKATRRTKSRHVTSRRRSVTLNIRKRKWMKYFACVIEWYERFLEMIEFKEHPVTGVVSQIILWCCKAALSLHSPQKTIWISVNTNLHWCCFFCWKNLSCNFFNLIHGDSLYIKNFTLHDVFSYFPTIHVWTACQTRLHFFVLFNSYINLFFVIGFEINYFIFSISIMCNYIWRVLCGI